MNCIVIFLYAFALQAALIFCEQCAALEKFSLSCLTDLFVELQIRTPDQKHTFLCEFLKKKGKMQSNEMSVLHSMEVHICMALWHKDVTYKE